MKESKTISLTEGSIFKTLMGLALPIMASSFLGTVYSITDMAWIGLLGAKAVAGVGVGGMFVWFSQGIASLPRMGGQVYVAQCFGRGEKKEAKKYAQAAVQMSFVFALIFSVICLVFVNQLVGFFQLEDAESLSAAISYTKITCGLILFSFLNITLTGLYTAQGDSKTPFLANLFGMLANMILDPVLILGIGPFPRMAVVGAALATVIAQFIVMVVMLIGIARAKEEENILKEVCLLEKPNGFVLEQIFRMGGPTALQGTAYCVISMVLTRMVSGFGAEAIATQRVGGQIESISWNTADGFAAALNAFVAQNYGAGHMERVKKGYRMSFWSVGIWGLLVTAAFVFFPGAIASVFFHEKLALEIAEGYLVIVGFSEAFMSVELMTVGALSGLGKTRLCSIISIVLTGARIPLAIILSATSLGVEGIWWALSATSILKGVIFYLVFWESVRKESRKGGD
ncbi:MAG: MATE family efflux transporter [Roseburia sp.]